MQRQAACQRHTQRSSTEMQYRRLKIGHKLRRLREDPHLLLQVDGNRAANRLLTILAVPRVQ